MKASFSQQKDSIIRNLSFLLVALTALVLSIRTIYSEDLGFHLQSARWMLENISFPDKDSFTYTANENRYIDLNWFYQLLIYGIYKSTGGAGLILVNSVFILLTIFILFRRVNCNLWFGPWIFLAGILAVSPLFEIRPHSLSWLMLSCVLFILQRFYDGNEKIIKWLPAVMLFWVNCHSLFILGLIVTGCYGAGIFFRKRKSFNYFLKWSAISVAACLLNPYGIRGLFFPFQQMFALQSGNIFKENIRELQSPFAFTDYHLSNILTAWHFFDVFLLILLIAIVAGYKRIKIHEWLILAVFFYFAISATKNIGYFVFAVLPIQFNAFLIREKKPALQKNNNQAMNSGFLQKYIKKISWIFIISSAILLLFIFTNSFYIHYRTSYRFGLGWSNSMLPVKATVFIQKNHLKGRIYNQLDFGGYLEYFTGQQVSIDGRLDLMGEKIFSEQVANSDDASKKIMIDRYKPDILIFSYVSATDWLTFLQKQNEWRLAYADDNAALFLRNNFAPEIPAMTEMNFIKDIPTYSEAQIEAIMKIEKPFSLFSSQYYPDKEFNKLAFCFYNGWSIAAKQIIADAFEKSSASYPELYLNLGTVYFQYKDAPHSLFCYEKYLEMKKNPQVEERVKFLKSLH